MLLANQLCAELLLENKTHSLYRVHPRPTEDKLQALRTLLGHYHINIPEGPLETKDLQKIIQYARNNQAGAALQNAVLGALSQAYYTPDNSGHFGLGYTHYTHFTSPIRRYPDLVVHRLIKAQIANNANQYTRPVLQRIARHCSATERRAEEASRYVMAWLKCEFMVSRIGQTFTGRIVSVRSFGVFVMLDSYAVEGLISIRDLGSEYYEYDDAAQTLTSRRGSEKLQVGQVITIRVARVDSFLRQIDFHRTCSSSK